MSIIVAKGEAICKSPTNNSKSKMLYSIPKDERFKKFKKTGSDVIYYPLPDMHAKRSTSFGYGKRSDFTKESKNKCQELYNIKSTFEDKKNGVPAYTFGISRSFYEKVYSESDTFHDKSFPGPGNYPILKQFGHEAKKFTMSGKLEPKNISKKIVFPGPTNYDTAPKLGIKQMFSKYKNTTNIIWSIDKSPRFEYIVDKLKFPGPEKYEIKPLINSKGEIFISKFKSSPAKTIGSRYYDKPKFNNVGPGSYKAGSDFGIYESKHKSEHLSKENERMASLSPPKEKKE